MKQKLLSILTLLLCVCSGAWASPITWTFNASDIKGNATFAGKGTNTFIADDGTTELVYKGNSDSDALVDADATIEGVSYTTYLNLNGATGSSRYMYISGISGSGTLTIVFASGKNNDKAVTVNDNAYDGTAVGTLDAPTSGNYNGTAKDIEISATLDEEHTYYINGHRSIYAVIWTPDDKVIPVATFSSSSFDLTPENYEDFSIPTLSILDKNSNDISAHYTVTYVSSNSTLAEVTNSSTGAVTIHPVEGSAEATITATLTPDDADAYAGKSVSYTISYKNGIAAQTDKFWKFSDSAWSSFPTSSGSAITENTIVDNLEVLADAENTAYIRSSEKTFSDGKLSKYIQFGQVKSGSRQLHIKVAGKSIISVYLNAGGADRKIKISKDSSSGTAVGTEQSVSSGAGIYTFNYTGTSAADLYIYNSGNNGLDFYGIKVEPLSGAPTITTQPVGATYQLNEDADVLTIAAEATNEGALSYQWYSNTTGTAAPESDTAVGTGASYTPSTSVSGTTYFYCVVTEEGNDEKTTSDIVAIKVVDLGELIVTLQPATIPSGDTAYPSNTFSANGFTLAASNANFWNSVLAKYPRIFKAQKDVTFTITAPSYATIKSIKILGTSNNDNNTASIDAGSGATAITSTTLKKRTDYTGSDNPELSEIILAVDAPSAGNSISFTTKSQQVRFYVEIYGTGTAPDQNISATKEYSTFCSAYDLDFTNVDGLEAYVVSAINESSATISKVNKVPASTGLILKKTANIGTASNFSVSVPTSTDDMGTNNMVGVLADTDMTSVENAYILSNGKFYECSGGTLAAGKAYLVAAAWASGDAREYSIVVDGSDDHTTSIDSINTQHPSTDSQRYNLAGQKVSENYKGIVIVNGKKYINK